MSARGSRRRSGVDKRQSQSRGTSALPGQRLLACALPCLCHFPFPSPVQPAHRFLALSSALSCLARLSISIFKIRHHPGPLYFSDAYLGTAYKGARWGRRAGSQSSSAATVGKQWKPEALGISGLPYFAVRREGSQQAGSIRRALGPRKAHAPITHQL